MWEEADFHSMGRSGVGLAGAQRLGQAPSGNLLLRGMRRIRCSRVKKPRDVKMDGDMMRT